MLISQGPVAGLLAVVLLFAVSIGVVVGACQSRVPTEDRRLTPWRAGVATAWVAGALMLGVLSRISPDLQACSATIGETDPSTTVEETTAADGTTSHRTSTVPRARSVSRSCSPVGVGELAVLLLPALIVASPALKGFNIAGLFGVDLKELKKEVATESRELVLRLIVERDRGEKLTEAMEETAAVDLPEE